MLGLLFTPSSRKRVGVEGRCNPAGGGTITRSAPRANGRSLELAVLPGVVFVRSIVAILQDHVERGREVRFCARVGPSESVSVRSGKGRWPTSIYFGASTTEGTASNGGGRGGGGGGDSGLLFQRIAKPRWPFLSEYASWDNGQVPLERTL